MSETDFDVIVIGASFAGLACAKVLSTLGLSVLVLERREDVGAGLHTTGILVDEAIDLLKLPKELCKPISKVRLYAPSGRWIEIESDSYFFQTTDTPNVMRHMVHEARDAGVVVQCDTAFENGVETSDGVVINDGAYRARHLVGADGARSKVAKAFELGQNSEFLVGVEAEFDGASLQSGDAFQVYLDRRFAPGYIGWAIPGPSVVQIGMATRQRFKPDIASFITHISPDVTFNDPNVVERRGGLIPVGGLVHPFFSDRVILVGDAAGLVSPLTAGGIHTALYYGDRLGNLLFDCIKGDGPHPGAVLDAEYPRFRLKLLMRKIFDRTPNWVFDLLIASPISQPIANAVFFLKKRLPRPSRSKP